MMDIVTYDMNIQMECVIYGEHVPKVDINRLTVKEIHRAHYHILPFKAMPKIMVRYHLYKMMKQLNYLPVKRII